VIDNAPPAASRSALRDTQDISWLGISLDRHRRLEEDNTSDRKGLTDEG
jgi:hypothetical protein